MNAVEREPVPTRVLNPKACGVQKAVVLNPKAVGLSVASYATMRSILSNIEICEILLKIQRPRQRTPPIFPTLGGAACVCYI